ncbi:MAG TPA: AAA family ATPase [Thermoanaerobaculia bacterium]|nr:AAA family ATPase [Thermoanaerobaculia bacterium]
MTEPPLVSSLPAGLEASLRDDNPWWKGIRPTGIPPFRRWAFGPVLRGLRNGFTPAVVLRGPRQIGKTTLLAQIVDQLLAEGVDPKRIFRVQFDEIPEVRRFESSPILELCRWYAEAVLRQSFHEAAASGSSTFILLDEVQNLADWAPQLKHLVDLNPVRVLVTGSSALRIEAGRDSLAGRVSTIEMGPLLLREIAEIGGHGQLAPFLPYNGLAPLKAKETWQALRRHGEELRETRDRAFAAFSARGAYPIAHVRPDEPWEALADFLNETVIRRAIQHDLRMGPRGQRRDRHLLEEVFRLACRYAGQTPSLDFCVAEVGRALGAEVGLQRVLNYLKFLDGTLLLRLVEPLELRLKRRRGLFKLCLCDHALRAAWLQEVVPLTPQGLAEAPHLADLAGRIAESVVGYFFRSMLGLGVAHFPERGAEREVDFVLTVGDQRIPVEVKYRRRIDHGDSAGLRSFLEKAHYNAPFGLLVTLLDEPASDDPRIVSLPLSSLLLLR